MIGQVTVISDPERRPVGTDGQNQIYRWRRENGAGWKELPALMRKLAAAAPIAGRDAPRFTIYNVV